MSLFRYFEPVKDGTSNVCKQASSIGSKHTSYGALGVSEKKATKVAEELKSKSTQSSEVGKTSRTQYAEKGKTRISRYAGFHGYRQSVRHFANEFPQRNESSIRCWTSTYKSQLVQQEAEENIIIGLKRGRLTLLSSELDANLRTMIQNMRLSGAPINIHTGKVCTVSGFPSKKTMGEITLSPYENVLPVSISSRPIITRALWEEISTQNLHDISSLTKSHEIPDELILNLGQSSSKFVAASKVTMAEKRSKHVSIAGETDKRCITLTVTESMSGQLLPLQVIYKGKTERCLPPKARDDKKCRFSYNEKHWSNNKETLRLIDGILLPYTEKTKKDLNLPNDQNSLLIWDAFTGQNTDAVKKRLSELNILAVNVPKNLTHLLQPLDLTTNATFKNIERKEFSNYLRQLF